MSILSQNLKTIRQRLRLNQEKMSDALSVGFRSYVRYEKGERDVPVSVLIAVSRLAPVSLDRLLTENLEADQGGIGKMGSVPKMTWCDMQSGEMKISSSPHKQLLACDPMEMELLSGYRPLSSDSKKRVSIDLKTRVPAGVNKNINSAAAFLTSLEDANSPPQKLLSASKIKPECISSEGEERKFLEGALLREKVEKLSSLVHDFSEPTVEV